MIFNSLLAWERTKASLCGRVALNGYKWDCQRQAIKPLSWSTKPTNAAVPGHLRAELIAQDNTLSIRNTAQNLKTHSPSPIPPRSSEEQTVSVCGNKAVVILY